MPQFDELVADAPVHFDSVDVRWDGYSEGLQLVGIDPASVVAATWCGFGEKNIEALIDGPQLTVIHSSGVFSSAGTRRMIGKTVKFDWIDFSDVRAYGPAETEDERGLGKYCIEFAGAGGMLLGRLQWSWRAKRFRDSRAEIMAVAEERDSILAVVTELLEGSADGEALASNGGDSGTADEIERLADMHSRGVLSDEEFAAAKRKALRL